MRPCPRSPVLFITTLQRTQRSSPLARLFTAGSEKTNPLSPAHPLAPGCNLADGKESERSRNVKCSVRNHSAFRNHDHAVSYVIVFTIHILRFTVRRKHIHPQCA